MTPVVLVVLVVLVALVVLEVLVAAKWSEICSDRVDRIDKWLDRIHFFFQFVTASRGQGACGLVHTTAFFRVAAAVSCTSRVPAGS